MDYLYNILSKGEFSTIRNTRGEEDFVVIVSSWAFLFTFFQKVNLVQL